MQQKAARQKDGSRYYTLYMITHASLKWHLVQQNNCTRYIIPLIQFLNQIRTSQRYFTLHTTSLLPIMLAQHNPSNAGITNKSHFIASPRVRFLAEGEASLPSEAPSSLSTCMPKS